MPELLISCQDLAKAFESKILVVSVGHRNASKPALERVRSAGGHEPCDRSAVPGDFHFASGSHFVEQGQHLRLGLGCGHSSSHMVILLVSNPGLIYGVPVLPRRRSSVAPGVQ